jgi:hypothetical protein
LVSGERDGISKTWTARSTPPAARRMLAVTDGGEMYVQDVAPRRSGRGRVMACDVLPDEKGRSWRCERYDESRM